MIRYPCRISPTIQHRPNRHVLLLPSIVNRRRKDSAQHPKVVLISLSMNSCGRAYALDVSHQTVEEIVTQTLLPGIIKRHAVRQVLDGLLSQEDFGQERESLLLACSQDTSLDFPDRALSRRSSRRFRCSWGTGKLSTSGLRLSQRNSNIFNFSVGANAANSAVLMPLVCNNPRQSQPRYSPIFSLPKNPRDPRLRPDRRRGFASLATVA